MKLCHPDAIKFRKSFNPNKGELTEILYKLYNEKVFENRLNLPITWNKKLTSTAGRCTCSKKCGHFSSFIHLRRDIGSHVLFFCSFSGRACVWRASSWARKCWPAVIACDVRSFMSCVTQRRGYTTAIKRTGRSGKRGRAEQIAHFPNCRKLPSAMTTTSNTNTRTSATCATANHTRTLNQRKSRTFGAPIATAQSAFIWTRSRRTDKWCRRRSGRRPASRSSSRRSTRNTSNLVSNTQKWWNW